MISLNSWRWLSPSVTLSVLLLLAGCRYDELSSDQRPSNPDLPVVTESLPQNDCSGVVVDGYSDKISYSPGETAKVYLQAKSSIGLCKLDMYTMSGKLAFSTKAFLTVQAPPPPNAYTQGYGYNVSSEFVIPTLPSGVYLIENRIPVIIKPMRPVDVMVVYPSNTANAYCESGGKSLYSKTDRPGEVSFLRPIPLENFSSVCLSWFTSFKDAEIGFMADIDLDNYANLNTSTVLVLVGHSEYWTRTARQNFDKFVQRGGHALVLSGNTMWWQVRYSADGTGMICHKSLVSDPIADPLLKTTLWTDPTLQYPTVTSIGADFDRGGYGLKADRGWNGYKIVNPASPLLEGLNLKKGDIISLPTVEYDGTPIAGFDTDGFPRVVRDSLQCDKIELIGFDRGFRVKETYGTFFIYRPLASSGYIINTCTTDWCSSEGMGGASGSAIKTITRNALTKLLRGQALFSR